MMNRRRGRRSKRRMKRKKMCRKKEGEGKMDEKEEE